MDSLPFLILVLEWTIRLMVVPIIALRCRPPAALAWVAIVSVQPFLGLLLFLTFGNSRLPRKRIAEHARHRRSFQLDLFPLLREYYVDPEAASEDRSRHLLSVQLGEIPALKGNSLELIDDTQPAIQALIRDIDEATQHVHILVYIWMDDETGRRVCDALIRAEQRGVQCRVLVDAVGSGRFLRNQSRRLREAGVEIHAALPVNPFRKKLARIDMRNHRKLAVIDGRIGYTGSQNICNADYGTRQLEWHDLMLRLTGPIVLQLQAVFCQDWYAETEVQIPREEFFPEAESMGQRVLELFPSGPTYQTQNLHRLLVAMIYEARHEVIITTPYFVPDESLLQAIEVARLRGVIVRLLLPERSDQILVSAAQRSFYRELLEMDVRISLFQPGLLHSKTMTVDNRFAVVGTSNMDIRSFACNLELNLILFDELSVNTVVQQQQKYLAQSLPLKLTAWLQRSRWKTLLEALARLLAPLL
ncbi:MAG: cardiolipin synthase [Planctomycetaceae bacterium]|nr:cardiolipin synthase [Planctomycetaceae bacterium]